MFKTNPVYRGRKLNLTLPIDLSKLDSLKLTPFIGDGNRFFILSRRRGFSLKLTPFIGDGNFIRQLK